MVQIGYAIKFTRHYHLPTFLYVWFPRFFSRPRRKRSMEKGGQLCKYTLFCMNAKKNWPRNACAYFQVKHHIFLNFEMRGKARRIFFRASYVQPKLGSFSHPFRTYFARGRSSPPLLACHAMQETLWPANFVHALFNDKGQSKSLAENSEVSLYNYAFTFWEKKWKNWVKRSSFCQ